MASIPEIRSALGTRDDITYIHPTLCPLSLADIPGVRVLSGIEHQRKPFYACTFADTATRHYVITSMGILVDEAYLDTPEDITVLNSAINLNVGYETPVETVSYGIIPSTQTDETRIDSQPSRDLLIRTYKNSETARLAYARDLQQYVQSTLPAIECSDSPFARRLEQYLLPTSTWYMSHNIDAT